MGSGGRRPCHRRDDRAHRRQRRHVSRDAGAARAYTDARNEHGQSELLDEIVSAKPEFDRHRYHSTRELHDAGLERIAEAAAVVGRKGTPQELNDYRKFVVTLASKVAAAHKEDGQQISPAEQAALNEIRDRLEQASA